MRRSLLALTAFLLLPPHAAWAAPTARETIEDFYLAYLSPDPVDRMKRRPAFSQAFLHDEATNKKACEEGAGNDICGWDADFNPYLNSQEYDGVTYNNITAIKETQPGIVQVKINLTPGSTEPNIANITYVMIKEEGAWVVDNIIEDTNGKQSFMARQAMRDETAHYKKQPKPAAE